MKKFTHIYITTDKTFQKKVSLRIEEFTMNMYISTLFTGSSHWHTKHTSSSRTTASQAKDPFIPFI